MGFVFIGFTVSDRDEEDVEDRAVMEQENVSATSSDTSKNCCYFFLIDIVCRSTNILQCYFYYTFRNVVFLFW
jgi:hypothetical protein